MRSYFNLFAAFAVFAQMAACSPSTPATEALEAARLDIGKYGTILSVEKMNGQAKQVNGLEAYVVNVRAAIDASDLVVYRWNKNARSDLAGRNYSFSRQRSPNIFTESIPLGAGTVMVHEINVTYSKTEKGWKFEDLERIKFGWCTPEEGKLPTAEECFSKHKLSS